MQITSDVYALDSTARSYAYLVLGPEPTLIDTSLPGSSAKILEEMREIGLEPSQLKHIVLTHHDVDHIGSASALRDATGATLWASQLDLPYILGERRRPGVKRLAEMLVKVPTPMIDKTYDDEGGSLPLEVIPTPGHTPGHAAFLYRDILFAGDLVTSKGMMLRPAPNMLTWDHTVLKASLRAVGTRQFEWVCPAHGQPIRRGQLWNQFV